MTIFAEKMTNYQLETTTTDHSNGFAIPFAGCFQKTLVKYNHLVYPTILMYTVYCIRLITHILHTLFNPCFRYCHFQGSLTTLPEADMVMVHWKVSFQMVQAQCPWPTCPLSQLSFSGDRYLHVNDLTQPHCQLTV